MQRPTSGGQTELKSAGLFEIDRSEDPAVDGAN
jgi:hypothetical protein